MRRAEHLFPNGPDTLSSRLVPSDSRSLMREFLCLLLRLSGIPLVIRETIQRRLVTILVYHRPDPRTAASHFEALRRCYTPISLQTYLKARRENATDGLPSKSVIITIDDGHKSVYQLKPILERFQIPVTVFVCSGFVGARKRFWFWASELAETQRQHLKTLSDEERLATLRAIGFADRAELNDRDSLNINELLELQHLIDVQSHSVSHPILPSCSEQKVVEEIQFSRRELAEHVGRPVNALAYPNGSYTEREVRTTRDAGYECGLTIDPGFNDRTTPPYVLKRLVMRDDCGVHELMIRSCGLWALLRSIKCVLTDLMSALFLVRARSKKNVVARA